MNWKSLLTEMTTVEHSGDAVNISGVEYDSRRVSRGDVFVAMKGGATDGNHYVESAIAQGAVAVVTDSRGAYDSLLRYDRDARVALVERGRRALAEVSSAILGHPERRLALSAVTGTNGKTTTAFLLEGLLRSVHRTCILIGTIETHIGTAVRPSAHTTPESRDILSIFADGVAAGATESVMEMSSHALEQERVWGMPVDVAIFTNLTQDHLDYHGTMERYFASKAKLFTGVGAPPPRVAVVNLDDEYGPRIEDAAAGCGEVWTYGLRNSHGRAVDFCAENVTLQAAETRFDWKTPTGTVQVRSSLTGRVNVYNLLAASCAALARGLSLEQIADATDRLRPVPGRFETVANTRGITVVVDYAHTDDALRNLIALARELVGNTGNGRVITLFGCGGDRDRTKRPKMGQAAGQGSDLVVLTSDNPRTEDPMAIINEALAGVKESGTACVVEEDRAKAIMVAIHAAKTGDVVLLAGKGHEKVQILRDGTLAFDDVRVAERVLHDLA